MNKANVKNVAKNVATNVKGAALATKNFMQKNYQALLFSGAVGVVSAFATSCDEKASPVKVIETDSVFVDKPIPVEYIKSAHVRIEDYLNANEPHERFLSSGNPDPYRNIFSNGMFGKLVSVSQNTNREYMATFQIGNNNDTVTVKLKVGESYEYGNGVDSVKIVLKNLGNIVPGTSSVYGFEVYENKADTTGNMPVAFVALNNGSNDFEVVKNIYPNTKVYSYNQGILEYMSGLTGSAYFTDGAQKVAKMVGDTLQVIAARQSEHYIKGIGVGYNKKVETTLSLTDGATGAEVWNSGVVKIVPGGILSLEAPTSWITSGNSTTITSTGTITINGNDVKVYTEGEKNGQPIAISMIANLEDANTKIKATLYQNGAFNLGSLFGDGNLVIEDPSVILNKAGKKGGISN